MTREEVFSKLTEIFRNNFDDDSIELRDETNRMSNVGEMADFILRKVEDAMQFKGLQFGGHRNRYIRKCPRNCQCCKLFLTISGDMFSSGQQP